MPPQPALGRAKPILAFIGEGGWSLPLSVAVLAVKISTGRPGGSLKMTIEGLRGLLNNKGFFYGKRNCDQYRP